MNKVLVSQTPVYQSIQGFRDAMLENLLHKTQQRMTSRLSKAINDIERTALARLSRMNRSTHASGMIDSKMFEQEVEIIFLHAAPDLAELFERLMRWTHQLATAAEFEAISQAKSFMHRAVHANPKRPITTFDGYQPLAAVEFYLAKLRRKICDAFDMARIRKDPPPLAMERIRRAFPDVKRIPRANPIRAVPKKLHEADDSFSSNKRSFTSAIIDEDDWKDMVEEFRDEYIPDYRDPRLAEEGDLEGQGGEIYDWEFEQQTTQTFVQQQLNGKDTAAKDLGVTDFIWIAVIDKSTDDDCAKRDGLTISQIEQKLAGEWKDDDEDHQGSYPPLHWNCRCTVAPLTDTVDPQPAFDEEDFTQWLNS